MYRTVCVRRGAENDKIRGVLGQSADRSGPAGLLYTITMSKIFKYIIFFLAVSMAGCGTHGSLKGYQYSIRKDSLQKAIMTVIKNTPAIYRDTSLDHLGSSPLLDHGATGDYSAGENFYNDIKHYVTITVSSGQEKNEYTFRYYGADEDWNTAHTSEIFIC